MTIQLRPHQSETISAVRAALPEHRSVLLYAPPGAGKTVMAAYIAKGASDRRRRVIFACHRRELINQAALTFDRFDISYGYIAAGMSANPFSAVQIASIDTLRNRYENHDADLIVVDEAHLSGAKTWTRIIDHYRAAGAYVVGLSGSPCRLDGKPLRANFRHMVQGPQVRWLIDHGYLSRYRAFAPTKADTAGLHVRAGDYVVGELEERFDKPSIIGDAVQSWRRFAAGKRTVVYSFSIDHSKHVVETFRAVGISAEHMDGTTPKPERQRIIRDFADGRTHVLSSVEILTTGFDLSAQVGRDVPIEAVSLLRPTKSLALAIQMMGRGLRPKPEPAIILDHANIFRDHGLPDDEREWSLDGVPETAKRGAASIPTCVCHECFAVFRPAYRCPYCHAVRQVGGREVDMVEGELSEVDVEVLREMAAVDFERRQKHAQRGREKAEERECGTDLRKWEALAAKRGFHRGWALHKCIAVRNRAA